MTNPIDYWYQRYLAEKKRADNLQSAIQVAEDRAYLAGQESMREKAISKLESLCKEWDLCESTEAKYRREVYSELINELKEVNNEKQERH
jgi:hypothetical protein